MADTVTRRATYQDILDLPDGIVGEILMGTLYTQPRPRVPHARAATRLGVKIGSAFDSDSAGPGGWVLLDEPELHLQDEILVPDLAGWRTENYPAISNDAFLTVPPDWVCEILSPSTAMQDRVLKSQIYAAQNVGYMWLVDPAARTLEVYRLTGGQWLQIAALRDDDLVAAEPFDAAPFKLDALWT